ncbi:DMT family transporter [Halarcobacter bivalviorum]|uniref:EamA family transporter n=1 Tax=Halarcobacter bivalviorum TaxID=663364 RepID=A0AAX2A4U1_9BACT|nr:DMT family transporter [Halarcobacter bivalviorum]AXH12857.1 EamA/RhaT family transporter [Halarcobacter bivalviorum]RXK09018.1 EamA family transporter [Halarcobacter bivalviorum]
MTDSNKNIFYILMFFAMIGWGGSWVNVKILSSYINEYAVMFFRYIITAITMIPIMLVLRKKFTIDKKSFFLVIVTSIILVAYMKYFFLGTKLGTASLGGAFVTTLIPINTFLILALLGSKKIEKKDYFALLLGAIGVLTMLNVWGANFDEIFVVHNLYFILASILWPLLTIVSSKATNISPIVFTFYMYIVTSLMSMFFMDFSTIAYEKFDYIFYINLFAITIFASTFANTIFFLGIEKLGAANVSSFIFLVPFAAITLSAIFLKENITISIIIGTIMTIIAVKILNNIKLYKKKKIEQ